MQLRRLSTLVEILHSIVPDVPGSSHSLFFFISACVHPVSILRVKINVRCSLITKSEWSSGNNSLSWFKRSRVQIPLTVFLIFISACVHPVLIIILRIDTGRYKTNCEWDLNPGTRHLSLSTRPLTLLNQTASDVNYNPQDGHRMDTSRYKKKSTLRVIINVRCSLLKKSEWSSGNPSLYRSRGPGFKSHSKFLLFISASVHPKGYN